MYIVSFPMQLQINIYVNINIYAKFIPQYLWINLSPYPVDFGCFTSILCRFCIMVSFDIAFPLIVFNVGEKTPNKNLLCVKTFAYVFAGGVEDLVHFG